MPSTHNNQIGIFIPKIVIYPDAVAPVVAVVVAGVNATPGVVPTGWLVSTGVPVTAPVIGSTVGPGGNCVITGVAYGVPVTPLPTGLIGGGAGVPTGDEAIGLVGHNNGLSVGGMISPGGMYGGPVVNIGSGPGAGP